MLLPDKKEGIAATVGTPGSAFHLSDDLGFLTDLSKFGVSLPGCDYLEVGGHWTLQHRAEALSRLVVDVLDMFSFCRGGYSDRFFKIPCAIGMPGIGKSRLMMIEFVGVVRHVTNIYRHRRLLPECVDSDVVASVLVTFNSRIGIHGDDPDSVDSLLAWHALHAFFGYEKSGPSTPARQRYSAFLGKFGVPHANYDKLTLHEAVVLISKAAKAKVIALVIDEVQVLNGKWDGGDGSRTGAWQCAELLKGLTAECWERSRLVVCCAIAGTRNPGEAGLIASHAGSASNEVSFRVCDTVIKDIVELFGIGKAVGIATVMRCCFSGPILYRCLSYLEVICRASCEVHRWSLWTRSIARDGNVTADCGCCCPSLRTLPDCCSWRWETSAVACSTGVWDPDMTVVTRSRIFVRQW